MTTCFNVFINFIFHTTLDFIIRAGIKSFYGYEQTYRKHKSNWFNQYLHYKNLMFYNLV